MIVALCLRGFVHMAYCLPGRALAPFIGLMDDAAATSRWHFGGDNSNRADGQLRPELT